MLQLTASDGVLTTNSTVAITVEANTICTFGWILNPVNQIKIARHRARSTRWKSASRTSDPETRIWEMKPECVAPQTKFEL